MCAVRSRCCQSAATSGGREGRGDLPGRQIGPDRGQDAVFVGGVTHTTAASTPRPAAGCSTRPPQPADRQAPRGPPPALATPAPPAAAARPTEFHGPLGLAAPDPAALRPAPPPAAPARPGHRWSPRHRAARPVAAADAPGAAPPPGCPAAGRRRGRRGPDVKPGHGKLEQVNRPVEILQHALAKVHQREPKTSLDPRCPHDPHVRSRPAVV
jgi:hypothetical protein